jgi:hypothetical protein
LQVPQKIHLRETVYTWRKVQRIPEYRPQFPDRGENEDDEVISLGEIEEGQTTLLEYYAMYRHGRNGNSEVVS